MTDFIFKGKSAKDMGVIMTQEWEDARPPINYEEIEIDGRNGAIYTPLNFKDISKPIECILLNKSMIQEVSQWLQGSGNFEINGRQKESYIFDQIDFSRHGPFKNIFTIPFVFSPFWYTANDRYIQYTECVVNNGNHNSSPMIKITGSGIAKINIADITLTITFDSSGQIEIDCLNKSEDKPKCISIGFDYPILKPGINKLSVIEGSAKIYIKRKDTWI